MMHLLAFTPLYDPLSALYPALNEYWLWMAAPLVLAISVVYKCTRITELRNLPKDAAIMSVQILLVMGLAAVVLATGYWAYLRLPQMVGGVLGS
jgi:hypothetical protein